jgi:hypothetical protein
MDASTRISFTASSRSRGCERAIVGTRERRAAGKTQSLVAELRLQASRVARTLATRLQLLDVDNLERVELLVGLAQHLLHDAVRALAELLRGGASKRASGASDRVGGRAGGRARERGRNAMRGR